MFNFLKPSSHQSAKQAANASKAAVKKLAGRQKKPAASPVAVHNIAGYKIPIMKSARRKSIAVKRHNQGLVIEVPKFLSMLRIQASLEKHQSWLLDQIKQHQHLEETLFTGLPGQSFEFLGETFYCHWSDDVLQNTRKFCEYQVCEQTKSLQMAFKPSLSQEKKQQLTLQSLEAFFKTQAKSYLQNKTDQYAQQMQLDYHSITIKAYKSRWGSCYPDGRLQYNWRLMQAPLQVVDYVVVHELAHRIHASHSRAFWDLVAEHYPATAAAKRELKLHGSRWIQLLQNR